MGYGLKANEPGIASVTIDGVDYPLPVAGGFRPDNPPRQSLFEAMNGRVTVDAVYESAGLPDNLDLFTFQLPYDTDSTNSTYTEKLETLRTEGGTHEFAYWKQLVYTYTLTAGQTVIYLPRPDAYGKDYSGYTDASLKATVTLDGVAVTIEYHASVTSATTVDAGELWISKAATAHADTGAYVALAKLGTAATAGQKLVVKYYPLFRVVVTGVPTEFSAVGREDKVLFLAETN